MYNEELKKRYLDTISYSGTRRIIESILKNAEDSENILNKDLCRFTAEETDLLIRSYSNKSLDMVGVNIGHLKSYVNFCIEEGYVPSRINYFDSITRNNSMKYVDKTTMENKYITIDMLRSIKEEMEEIRPYNEVDMAILQGLWVGLRGKELEELINLKIQQVFPDKIVLPDKRELPITEEDYNIFVAAHQQEEYEPYIDDNKSHDKWEKARIVMPSDYIIRPMGKSKEGAPMSYAGLLGKFSKLKTYFNYPFLTTDSVWRSGMFNKLSEIEKINGEITKEDIWKVHDIYGYSRAYDYKTKLAYEEFKKNYK